MVARHLRVTASGTFDNTPEIFSYGLALSYDGIDAAQPWGLLEPSNDSLNDVADTIAGFHSDPNVQIPPQAVLRQIKVAQINTDGTYGGAPWVKEYQGPGGGAGGAYKYPTQTALCITTQTGTFPVRRGRFYIPAPTLPLDTSGRLSAADALSLANYVEAMIEGINNNPGVDLLNLRVVLARANGTKPDIASVKVGRVFDTIRRRRNRLLEGYSPDQDV